MPHASAPGTVPNSLTSRALPSSARPAVPPRLRARWRPLHALVQASGSWGARQGLREQREQPGAPRAATASSPAAPRRCGTAPAPRRRSPSRRAGLGPAERPRLPAGPTPLACQRFTLSSRRSAPSFCSSCASAGCSPSSAAAEEAAGRAARPRRGLRKTRAVSAPVR